MVDSSAIFYPTFPQRAASFRRAERAIQRKTDSSGNTHKIPQMSYLRRETPAIFRLQLIGSPIQMNKTHKTNKDADESEKADQ